MRINRRRFQGRISYVGRENMKIRIEKYDGSRIYHLIWGPIALLILVTAGILKDLAVFLPHCLFHQVTGLPCLTCGMTRAAIYLSEFNLPLSFHYNPLLPIVFFSLLLFSSLHLVGYLSSKRIELALSSADKRIIRISVIVAVLGNWAYLIAAGI